MAQEPNPVVKGWKYMSAWFGNKIDERADPKVQIEQAIQEAQRQHQALTQQAAAVIGNQRQLQMQLDRQLNTVEDLRAQARQSLVLADQARAAADTEKADRFEDTARALANQLVGAESSVDDLKALHDQALQAAQQAREAVQTNSMILQEKLAERSKLLSQLEQAKMQETVANSLQQVSELAAPGNVPTLDEVRDKIERRYATALGRSELAQDSTAGRLVEVRRAALDAAGSARLAEIRASLDAAGGSPALGSGQPGSSDAAALGDGSGAAAAQPALDAGLATEARVVDTTKKQPDGA